MLTANGIITRVRNAGINSVGSSQSQANGKGEKNVVPHGGGQRNRVIRQNRHQDAGQSTTHARGDENPAGGKRVGLRAGLREHCRLHKNDIGEGHEGRHTAEQFPTDGCFTFAQVKDAVKEVHGLPRSVDSQPCRRVGTPNGHGEDYLRKRLALTIANEPARIIENPVLAAQRLKYPRGKRFSTASKW